MPTDDQAPVDHHPATIASIPRLRRMLREHQSRLRCILDDLVAYKKTPSRVTAGITHALACAALDRDYPRLDTDDDPVFANAVASAGAGGLKEHIDLAIENVQNALRICISGRESLALIDALDETVPTEWHNLPPSSAARRLNQFGHALARGSIPGWDEGRR